MKPPDSPRAAFCLAGKEAKSRITPCKARNAEKGVTVKEQQISYRDISEIHPYEHNPRNNDAAVEPVAQSIKNFGFRVPILIDREGTIIAGHTRYKAAQLLLLVGTGIICRRLSYLIRHAFSQHFTDRLTL